MALERPFFKRSRNNNDNKFETLEEEDKMADGNKEEARGSNRKSIKKKKIFMRK